MQGSFDEAVRTGFRRHFECIIGANVSAAEIEMTPSVPIEPKSLEAGATVASPQRERESVARTTPAGVDIDGWSIGHVPAADYTAATAPVPTGAGVQGCDDVVRCVSSLGGHDLHAILAVRLGLQRVAKMAGDFLAHIAGRALLPGDEPA